MAEQRPGAQEWVPPDAGVDALRDAVPGCRGCELWAPATQAVFSSGPAGARVLLVGEQPGDQEDRRGEPFVGPAGRVLREALAEAGIDVGAVYLTNAVKHFRFEERGNRRIHKKPGIPHVDACRPWLAAELAAVRPDVVVCLGATAARSVLGRDVTVQAERGRPLDAAGGTAAGDATGTAAAGGGGRGRAGGVPVTAPVLVTAHPSAVLRLRGREGYEEAYAELVADLRVAAGLAGGTAG